MRFCAFFSSFYAYSLAKVCITWLVSLPGMNWKYATGTQAYYIRRSISTTSENGRLDWPAVRHDRHTTNSIICIQSTVRRYRQISPCVSGRKL